MHEAKLEVKGHKYDLKDEVYVNFDFNTTDHKSRPVFHLQSVFVNYGGNLL